MVGPRSGTRVSSRHSGHPVFAEVKSEKQSKNAVEVDSSQQNLTKETNRSMAAPSF